MERADLQAAIVTLVLVLGGGTISNILLGTVPGWVVSPIPVLTYGLAELSSISDADLASTDVARV